MNDATKPWAWLATLGIEEDDEPEQWMFDRKHINDSNPMEVARQAVAEFLADDCCSLGNVENLISEVDSILGALEGAGLQITDKEVKS